MTRGILVLAIVLALIAGLARSASPAAAHSCVKGNELWFRAGDGTTLWDIDSAARSRAPERPS